MAFIADFRSAQRQRAPLHRAPSRPSKAYPEHASDAHFANKANKHRLLCVSGFEICWFRWKRQKFSELSSIFNCRQLYNTYLQGSRQLKTNLHECKEMLESLPAYDLSPKFPCESVSPSEIFAYTIPFGLDPANDQYAKFRPSFTSHLIKCQTCLGKMQELHNTIYAILERPDLGIVTWA